MISSRRLGTRVIKHPPDVPQVTYHTQIISCILDALFDASPHHKCNIDHDELLMQLAELHNHYKSVGWDLAAINVGELLRERDVKFDENGMAVATADPKAHQK